MRLAPDAHDWTIYTSVNAVEASLAMLPRPSRCRVAAVGRATALALREHGIAVDALPEGRSDSEGLLAVGALANVAGQRILILRGVGGRELLREELSRRGGSVQVGEVYLRRQASPSSGALQELDRALGNDARALVVAVTSVEVLDGLLGFVPAASLERLRSATLLVPGHRVADAATGRGWMGAVVVARSAEDASMIEALEAHVAGRRVQPRP
jgi:uroporphyrinogen-III synthase